MSGAIKFYDSCANDAAKKFGIMYDGISVFTLWTSIDRIESAIVYVANASVRAVLNSVSKSSEENAKTFNNEIYDKLSNVFGRNHVMKSTELAGRNSKWDAHNVVSLDKGHRAIFEFVSCHSNSVANKYLMFSDISQTENSFSLNSVVSNLSELGSKGNMLADVSNIIQLSSPPEEYKRLAKSAA